MTYKLNTLPSRRPKQDEENRIYIHRNVEFESTTELHSKDAGKEVCPQRETWLDTNSVEIHEARKGRS